ncbi:MAG: hypothetical protein ABIJ12_11685 [bacterium]
MIYTNKLNLPEVFLNVLLNDEYDRGDADISVSSLLLPPRIFQLRERHKDEITVDVIDEIWKIMGKSIHNLLEANAPQNSLVEERLFINIGPWKVSGKFDIYDGGIDDYKFTSGWAIVFGSRIEEWKKQLNFYRVMAVHYNLEVNRLRNILIIRDWSEYQAKQKPAFPQRQVHIINQPIENYDTTLERMYDLVKIHRDTCLLSDNDLPICTPEERWQTKDVWAVMKEGRKSAVKLFNDKDEALAYTLGNRNLHVEDRPGESKRCESYCEVNQFCNYYKSLKKGNKS